MAITNAQQERQLRRRGGIMGSNAGSMLVTPTLDGSRPGYYGPDAGFGDDDYKDAAADFASDNNPRGAGVGITDDDAQRVFDARPDLKEAYDNAEKEAEKRRKAKEKADKERRAKEKKEARKEKTKLTKAEKKKKRMQKAAFDRFQELEKYVDPFGDYTTFADMSGIDAAKMAGYNVNEFGPPGSITFDYDESRFRDPKTGKIKDELTEMVDINKGKKDIFGNPKKPKFVEQLKPDAIPGYDFSINPVRSNFEGGLGTLTSNPGGVRPNDYGLQMSKPPGFLGLATDIVRPETGLQAFNTLEEARNIQDLTTRFAGGDDSAYDEFEDYINRNKPPVATGGGGDQEMDPCKGPNPPAYCFVNQDPTTPTTPTPTRNLGGLAPRFAGSIFDFTGLADGGRVAAMGGGLMNTDVMGGAADGNIDEAGRQMYFLGKLVKKATRAVKKVVKSPFGKAALGAALTFGIPGTSFGGLSSVLKNKGIMGSLFGQAGSRVNEAFVPYKEGFFTKLGLTKGGGSLMPTLKGGLALGLGVPFALDLLGVGKDDDDKMDLDDYYRKNSINIADIRMNPYNYLAPRFAGSRFAADGGLMRMGYQEGGDAEPVAKKTMPLIDMDGQEKDYRETGGFVDMGRMERADDVPARLSKNEFVFTADAVRNAGEGDIDKGAEVMYNMMKNLESGGDVSEESQGLDGAREMFQTSQRLEEVL